MNNNATPIKDIAKGIIGSLSGERETREDRIKEAWEKAVGKRFSKHTEPTSFKKKRLIISVDSSSALYELTMRKDELITKLKSALKDDLAELQFRIGKIEKNG
ncbi:MAG: DUF721 domain-containing protein [Candidatus Omnitrophica bacterium]|nr:DUF721 domain-containing protein [Candidatus Omnitrophota bacterium]